MYIIIMYMGIDRFKGLAMYELGILFPRSTSAVENSATNARKSTSAAENILFDVSNE